MVKEFLKKHYVFSGTYYCSQYCGTDRLGDVRNPIVTKRAATDMSFILFVGMSLGRRWPERIAASFHWGIGPEKCPEPIHAEAAHYVIDIGMLVILNGAEGLGRWRGERASEFLYLHSAYGS